MYIHAKIHLHIINGHVAFEIRPRQWETMGKIYPSLAGQNNMFKFVKQKKFVLKSIVLQESLIVKGSWSPLFFRNITKEMLLFLTFPNNRLYFVKQKILAQIPIV